MGVNAALKARMAELDLKQEELAGLMNAALIPLTGRPGEFSDRTIRNLLNGTTRYPAGRTAIALEAVLERPMDELGFSKSGTRTRSCSKAPPPENPVLRRQFITSATAAAASAIPALPTPPLRVGVSDIDRLVGNLGELAELDQRDGGNSALEKAALDGAQRCLGLLQRGSVAQRVQRRLFALAADYTASAAWYCIDARDGVRSQQHLDRAMTLAGMAQDGPTQLRVWNSIAMLARQHKRPTDALAAAQAAQAVTITRRDPLYASLAHARTAVGYSTLGDGQAALRSLGRAQEALAKAHPEQRPSWVDFYGHAELHHLTAAVHEELGMPAEAEAAAHRGLALIPDAFRRNRALITVRLAVAQLRQGDVDLATTSASSVFDIMAGTPIPGRMRTSLGDFHRDLVVRAAGTRQAQEWTERHHSKWS